MKKIIKLLSLGLLTFSLAACSCNKDEENYVSQLENSSQVINGSKTSIEFTTQDIYNYIRENSTENVNKTFLTMLMENLLDLENNATNKTSYNLKVKKYFKDTYLDSDTYKVNGVFDEEILASTLESKLYVVDRVNLPTSGPTVELGLKYDYSDFIKRGLNYDIYLQILKGEYILNEKKSLLDNSKTRIISIYSNDDLDEMEKIVEDLFKGEYENLNALTASKKQEEIDELRRQYCSNLGLYPDSDYEGTCSASTSSSTYDSALYKFTVCENGVRCAPSEGLAYQIKLVNEKEYLTEQVVNKNTTDILYPEALSQLFRSDVEDYLHEVIDGEDPFLADWLYNHNKEFSQRDIILTTGPDSTAYLVTVRVVDSNSTSLEDKEEALSLLLDKVSDASVLLHYLENEDIKIDDPTLSEYFNSLVGK